MKTLLTVVLFITLSGCCTLTYQPVGGTANERGIKPLEEKVVNKDYCFRFFL